MVWTNAKSFWSVEGRILPAASYSGISSASVQIHSMAIPARAFGFVSAGQIYAYVSAGRVLVAVVLALFTVLCRIR